MIKNSKLKLRMKYMKINPPKNSTFFITYGPPASGKGGIMKKVINEENKKIEDESEKKI